MASDSLINSVVVVATSIVGVATLAVLVSKQAETSQVIQAGGNAFTQALQAAVSPVTGQSVSTSNLSML